MKKALLVIACAFVFSACEVPAEKKVATTNNEVKVEVLTTFDGITLYRITGGADTNMRPVYVARETSRGLLAAQWSHAERQGKVSNTYDDFTLVVK